MLYAIVIEFKKKKRRNELIFQYKSGDHSRRQGFALYCLGSCLKKMAG